MGNLPNTLTPKRMSFKAEKFFGSIVEGWNFNSGNYLFTTDTKWIHVLKLYCPSM